MITRQLRLLVEHAEVPSAAIRFATSARRSNSRCPDIQVQCSIVETPASTDASIASAPWACAATGSPCSAACATISRSCRTSNCDSHMSAPP